MGTALPRLAEAWAELLPGVTAQELRNLLPPTVGNLHAVLGLYEGQYRLAYQEDGVYRARWISHLALRQAVLNEFLDFGWMVEGIVGCGAGQAGLWFMRYLSPSRQTITLQGEGDEQRLTLPFPPLLLVGYGTQYYLWALRTASWSPEAPLYHAPFPNIGSAGQICWGDNVPGPVTAAAMETTWRLFLQSPFNGHWASGKSRAHDEDVRGQLLALGQRASARRYPCRDLIPFETTAAEVKRAILRRSV